MAVVMGVLIVSFGVWGIADIFKGFGQSTLATIGSTEISIEAFRQIYNDRLQQLSRQFGRPLTQEQARLFGLDRQVLQQIDCGSRPRRGSAPHGPRPVRCRDAARRSTTTPTSRASTASSMRPALQAVIRQVGYTEQRYLAEQRRVSLRRQITGTISAGLEPPKLMVDALTRFQNEQRSIDYIKLDAAQAGTIDPPSPETLAAYFEDRKVQFRAPEYRKMSFAMITPEEIGKWSTVSDEDARKIYDERKDKMGTPDKREVSQIVFPTHGRSRSSAQPHQCELLLRGSRQGARAQSVRLRSRPDREIRDHRSRRLRMPPSRLPSGEVSQPVQGRFGVALVKVGKIEPATVPSYDSVAATIKKEIATANARAKVNELQGKMEDERGGGASVVEAAQKLGLTAVTIDAVDRSGRTPNGQLVANIPRGLDVVVAGLQQRCRRRQRPDPVQRRLCLVRRDRHHAVARTSARRGPRPGRGEMARGPDRKPPAHQGRRDGQEARTGRQSRRRSGCRRFEGREREGLQARGFGRGRALQRDHRGLPHAEGRRRTERLGQRMDRLQGHRRHRCRRPTWRPTTSRSCRTRCSADWPTSRSRNT